VFVMASASMLLLAGVLMRALPDDAPSEKLPYGELLGSVIALVREQPVLRRRMALGAVGFGCFSALWTPLAFLLSAPPYNYGNIAIGLFGLAGVAGALAAPIAGRLADRGVLDLIAACSLDLAGDTGGHPEREVGSVHDRVDLEVADISIPEFDPSQRSSTDASGRTPPSPAGAWYTRVRRLDIAVTTSHEFVVRDRASSAALISWPPCRPSRTNSSDVVTGAPGTSVTSAMTASIATLPTNGTRRPRTIALARFDSARDQPSP